MPVLPSDPKRLSNNKGLTYMKTTIKGLLGMSVLLLAAQANAVMITDAGFEEDVGEIDTLVASTDNLPNSGERTEIGWVNDILNLDPGFTELTKEEPVQWYHTDETNVIAFGLQTGPGYYLVKNDQWWVLFQNLSEFDWGVISLDGLGFNVSTSETNPALMTVSHVSEFGEAPPPPPPPKVPEPGTLGLLGLAALGLGLVRRRHA